MEVAEEVMAGILQHREPAEPAVEVMVLQQPAEPQELLIPEAEVEVAHGAR
jgi:hypothetical protein